MPPCIALCGVIVDGARQEPLPSQTKFYFDDRSVKFAGYLHRNYGLDITFAAALEQIKK
jgi:hypothetical protein